MLQGQFAQTASKFAEIVKSNETAKELVREIRRNVAAMPAYQTALSLRVMCDPAKSKFIAQARVRERSDEWYDLLEESDLSTCLIGLFLSLLFMHDRTQLKFDGKIAILQEQPEYRLIGSLDIAVCIKLSKLFFGDLLEV